VKTYIRYFLLICHIFSAAFGGLSRAFSLLRYKSAKVLFGALFFKKRKSAKAPFCRTFS